MWQFNHEIGGLVEIMVPPHKFSEWSEWSEKFHLNPTLTIKNVQE
jgi:Carboxypeptidase activation peptide